MKIVISTETSIPRGVGDTMRIMQMANALQKVGHEVTIFSYKVNGIASNYKLKQINLWQFISQYRSLMKEEKVDVFLTNSLMHAKIAIENSVVPVVYDVHDPVIPMLHCSRFLGLDTYTNATFAHVSEIEKFVTKNANLIICASPRAEKWFISQGRAEDKIKTVLNGVPAKYLEVKKEHIYGDFPIIIHEGNLSNLFDYNTIIKSTICLLDRFEKIRFVFMGQGSLRKYLQSLSLFYDDRVVVEEWLESEDFPKHVAAGDIGIHSVAPHMHGHYACHMKTFDYMGLGLPVVGTDMDYSMEIVKIANAGIVVPPNNWEKFVEAVTYLIENPNVAKRLGDNGRSYAKRKMTWEIQLREFEKTLRNFA